MIEDPRSKTFTSTFAREWLSLDEILKSKEKYAKVHAYYNQPIEFVDYLIRENRPIIEAVDSKVTFVNNYLMPYYDAKDTKSVPLGLEALKVSRCRFSPSTEWRSTTTLKTAVAS